MKRWLAGQVELGSSVKIGGPYMQGELCEIVGIAADVSQEGLDSKVAPEVYLAVAQSPQPAMVEMIRTRTDGDAEPLMRDIRAEVARLGPGVPVQSLKPVTVLLRSTLDRRRFGTFLLVSFAALAFVLAAIGIYGLLEFWVGMRRREIALRLVLGASRGAILRLTGWQTARLVLVGCAIGVCAAYFSSRWLGNLVYGTAAADPRWLAASAFAMIALGALASAIPLWRAVRVNEAEQLHRT
jgi:putative ABC transport system permease protein